MKSSIKIKAPATVANVGCGYDTIGFALDGIYEEIEVRKRTDKKLVIVSVEGADLSLDPEENVATIAIRALLDHLGLDLGFDITIRKLFLPGSGLGSSASSAAGAVYATNLLLPEPLTTPQLLPFALEGEAFASKCYHADNVAPSLLGGCIAIRSYNPLDYFKVPIAQELALLVVRPFVEIKTSEAKGLIPKHIPVAVARNQWGNVAGLIHALHTKDWDRLATSIEDFIAEPVRKALIPCYDQAKAIARQNHSIGFNISGSGPSVFAFFKSDADRQQARLQLQELYRRQNIACNFFETQMSEEGCSVIG